MALMLMLISSFDKRSRKPREAGARGWLSAKWLDVARAQRSVEQASWSPYDEDGWDHQAVAEAAFVAMESCETAEGEIWINWLADAA